MPTTRAPRGPWSSPSGSRPRSATAAARRQGRRRSWRPASSSSSTTRSSGCEPYRDYGVAALREPAIAPADRGGARPACRPRRRRAGRGQVPVRAGRRAFADRRRHPPLRRAPSRTSWCCSSMPTPTCATATRASATRMPPPCAACWTCRACRSSSVGIRAISHGGGRVLRGQPRPHHHPLGQGPGALGHRGDRRAARGAARSMSPSTSMRSMPRSCRRRARRRPAASATGRRSASCGAPARRGSVVGADLVEFAPIAGLHAFDYTAAALAYKMLSYALSRLRGSAVGWVERQR